MKRFASALLAGTLLGVVGAGVVPATAGARMMMGCAPGTFDDTDHVVATINATIAKELKPVDKAFKKATLNPGDIKTKQTTTATGLLRRTTLSRSIDGLTYWFELALAQPSATPDFVVIGTASRTDAGTVNGVHTTNKEISADYDARRSFVPTSKATGNFDATIADVNDPTQPAPGTQRTLNVTFAGITVKMNDPHGARSGTYTHVGEPGIGGSLDYHGSIPVPCPADPTMGAVDVTVQRRHIDDASGERFFRRDAVVTDGSLGAGEQAIAFVCGTNPPKGSTAKKSSYTLHKVENADGTTKRFRVTLKNETAPNCNASFGALVTPTDNSTDWTFPHPVTFPGQW